MRPRQNERVQPAALADNKKLDKLIGHFGYLNNTCAKAAYNPIQ